MAEAVDPIKLYSKRILALAASIPRAERLAEPDASVSRRSPLCGSMVTVDVRMARGKVAEYGQDVKACALGQASAAILGARAVGLTLEEARAARDGLRAMLKEGAPPPEGAFAELEVLSPARDYKNRHASILLAYDALVEAIERAGGRADACNAGG